MFHTAGWRGAVYLFEYYGLLGGGDDEILHTAVCCDFGNTGNLCILSEAGSLPAEPDLRSRSIKNEKNKILTEMWGFYFFAVSGKGWFCEFQESGRFR